MIRYEIILIVLDLLLYLLGVFIEDIQKRKQYLLVSRISSLKIEKQIWNMRGRLEHSYSYSKRRGCKTGDLFIFMKKDLE